SQAVAGLEDLGVGRTRAAAQAEQMNIAVIGAGWAGCAAAWRLKTLGHQPEVFEASRHIGGRARRVRSPGLGRELDNGQHILLGAYSQALQLMRELGLDE